MSVPFDIAKYEKEKLDYEIKRFFELQKKYKNNIDEIIEFAELWKKFFPNTKYRD